MMRAAECLMTAAVVVGVSCTAMAQTPTNPTATAAAQAAAATSPEIVGPARSHWTAAGFVGANFGPNSSIDNSSSSSLDYGGEIGYLWRGVLGLELLADFTPSFELSNIFLAAKPGMNSYMANAVLAVPLGAQGQWQPYLSGGGGGLQLRTTVFSLAVNPLLTNTPATATNDGDQAKWGWDLGGGLAAYMGKVGFRADVRYYKAETSNTFSGTPTENFTEGLLSGIHFWRANGGLAFRW